MSAPPRNTLIGICDQAIVNENRWTNRDSAMAQMQLAQCRALLAAGCAYRMSYDPLSDENTLWVEITYKGFYYFEGGEMSEKLFYIPTRKRLRRAAGGDWY